MKVAGSVLVVIVNYRTAVLTLDCLASLEPEIRATPGARAVVVDNDSGDGSADVLGRAIPERGWSDWLELVVSDKNLGFAGGNNLGIERGEPAEFVLLLNSDTIVHPGCLARCIATMREQPGAGAMSCRVLNADGTIQNVTRRFPSPLLMTCVALGLPWRLPRFFSWADAEDPDWDRTTEGRDVDWLGGAFLFVRTAAFDGKVRLDDDFFFYGEDVAFSHRLATLGWSRRYDPVASIVHLGGASSDPSRMPSTARSLQIWRSRYLLQKKCYGRLAAVWLKTLDRTQLRLKLLRARGRGRADQSREFEEQLAAIRAVAERP